MEHSTEFGVLVADPPWQFGDTLPDGRGAEDNYKTLSLSELVKFPLPTMAADSTLFLWRVASMQHEALYVLNAWGFVLKTEIVWLKRTKYGKRWFGMGRTVRAEHETCLIATRGRPITLDKSIRSTFEAKAGRHSEKPEEFFTIVERLRQGPYCELFARRVRQGWTCLGDEIKEVT